MPFDAQLSSFWDKYKNQLVGGGLGAGLGAAGLAGYGALTDDGTDPEESSASLKRNLLLGGLLGGGAGVGAGTLFEKFGPGSDKPGNMRALFDRAWASPSLQGAAAANVAHGGAKKLMHMGKGTQTAQAAALTELKDGLANALTPDANGSFPANSPGTAGSLRSAAARASGTPGLSGWLSQTRLGRNLGFNLGNHESEIAAILSPLRDLNKNIPLPNGRIVLGPSGTKPTTGLAAGKVDGAALLQEILGPKGSSFVGGKSPGLPFALAEAAGQAGAVRAANFRSLAGRSAFGAGLPLVATLANQYFGAK